VTQAQSNLKRVDSIIVWNEVVLENGRVVYGEDGEPVLALDEEGNPIVRVNADHVYIHEDAQYFAAPGS
jgi:hypothetical protein